MEGGRYYLIDEFNSMKFNESRFVLLYLNARSLNKNIDQLALFLNAINTNFLLLLSAKLGKIKIFQVSLTYRDIVVYQYQDLVEVGK